MNKKKPFDVNIGSSSILLIFVTLCLVSFAALSIVSANADYKLSEKIMNRTTAYYEACNTAEESIAVIDHTLRNVYETTANEEEYFQSVGYVKSFMIEISDFQTLNIKLNIQYPSTEEDPFYRISSWKIVNTVEPEYEDTLPVISN